MSGLRVAYILKKYPRLSETFILNEMLELERQGASVSVYSLRRPDDGRFHPSVSRFKGSVAYAPDLKGIDGLQLFQRAWPTLKPRREALAMLMEEALLLPDLRGLTELMEGLYIAQQILKRGGVEHLHAHFATGASFVARIVHHMTGLPYSFTAHAKDIYRDAVDPERFQKLVRDAAFVITVCEANKSFIELKLLGRPELKLRRLYNGIDLELFAPDHSPRMDPPLVLAVGRLIEKKGFHVLLKACATLRDQRQAFQCIIVGEGEDRERLLQQRNDLQLGALVELVGAKTHDEVRALLQRTSVVCLPCVTAADGNRDALPTVLLEALACGVPAISTPVGGVAEIFGDSEGGLLVPENNAFSLASAIRYVLSNATVTESLGIQGRKRAERLFDLRANVAELHTLMRHGTLTEATTVHIVEQHGPRPEPRAPLPFEEFEV
ncbi:MAG: glycosyltransferase [Planctomycetota bacterium]